MPAKCECCLSDQIPNELKRIVEFLNGQMKSAEVLALELRQFEGQGLKTLVPMVYGQTQEAQQNKATGAPKPLMGFRIDLHRIGTFIWTRSRSRSRKHQGVDG